MGRRCQWGPAALPVGCLCPDRITSYNVCYTKLLRLGLVLTDRHGEAAADNVAKNVVEDEVEVLGVGPFLFQEVDRRDDTAAGAADARLRTARLDARITSYNVCYTKLLRPRRTPPRHPT